MVAALGADCDAGGGPFEMLSWDEARILAGDGQVSLYPRTVTHPILARCSDEKVEFEISEVVSDSGARDRLRADDFRLSERRRK